MTIVLLGDVDSGKSTLMGRLLYDTGSVSIQAKSELERVSKMLGKDTLEFAFLLDSFQEERIGEFTLDTTQAFIKGKEKEFLLIDVPGHKELLTNMLTGASYADSAVLVIDAFKSVQEQTQRHLFILKFLGIEEVLIVVNKMDLSAYSQALFSKIEEECVRLIKAVGIKSKAIVPVSAMEGENLTRLSKKMPWYKEKSLLDFFASFKDKELDFPDLRFPVQDIYHIGCEAIVAGGVVSGSLKSKDTVRAALLDVELKVKAIKALSGNKGLAIAPDAAGIVFEHLPEGIKRGEVFYRGSGPLVATELHAKIFCLMPIKKEDKLVLSCLGQDVSAGIDSIVEHIDTSTLEAKRNGAGLSLYEAAEVVLKTRMPLACEKFTSLPALGRFMLLKDSLPAAVGIIC